MGKIVEKAEQVLQIFGGIFFCLTMFLIVFNVIGRSFFNAPIPGAYELTGWGTSFFAAVAIPIATMRNTHIRVDILVNKIKGVPRLILEIFATVCDILFAALLTFGGFKYAIQMLAQNEVTNSLAVPIGPARLVWAISVAVMVVVNIRKLFLLRAGILVTDDGEEDAA